MDLRANAAEYWAATSRGMNYTSGLQKTKKGQAAEVRAKDRLAWALERIH